MTRKKIKRHLHKKPTGKIILNGDILNAFPLRLGKIKRFPLSTILFNIRLEVLASAIRQEKELKNIQIEKEAIKLSLDMIIFIEM